MTKHLVIGIDWFGPYSRAEASEAGDHFDGGLYMAVGKPSGSGRHVHRPRYIGISKTSVCTRASIATHHKLKLLNPKFSLWIGQISTSEPAGRRSFVTPTTLRYAEWLHVYFMNLPLNERGSVKLPQKPVTVLNRWWHTNLKQPRLRRPCKEWPDLIDYAGKEYRARKVWFRAPNQVVYSPPDFD